MRRRARVAVFSFAVTFGLVTGAGAASWPRRMGNSQNTNDAGEDAALTPASAPTLAVVGVIPTAGPVNATPVVADGLLFIGDWTGRFYVVDLRSGVRLVDLDTGSGGATGATNVAGSYIGVQSTASIATVTVPDGKGGTIDEKRVYVAVNQQPRTLFCLNVSAILADASRLQSDPGTGYFCRGAPWPISLAAQVVAGSPNGKYNGSLLFSRAQSIASPGTGKVEVHDVLYAPSTGLDCANGQLYAIDAYSAERYWTFDPVVNGDGNGGVIWGNPAMSVDGKHLFVATGDCVTKPQAGEKAESMVALDPANGAIQWWHQRRLVDAADFDVGNSPTVVDVAGPSGCHRIVSTDKDGCMYGFEQGRDVPQVGERGFDPLRPGQQRMLWRTCFVVGSLNGGFNASGASFHGRWAFAQANPPLAFAGDNATAFAVDACTGAFTWASAAVAKGRGEGAIASGMYFQPGGARLQVFSADDRTSAPFQGKLLATVALPSAATPGGGGPAIADGRIYVPLASGGVAVVAPTASATAPPQDVAVQFKGPYPLPLAPTGSELVPANVDANDPYPVAIDPGDAR